MSSLPSAPFPIFTSVDQLRKWRREILLKQEDVGFVPTMGALHAGHLSLVNESLANNHHTIISIFVNPAQFSPSEDLSTYPRTIESDIQKLAQLSVPPSSSPLVPSDGSTPSNRRVSALFLPPVSAMYPSGISQDVSKQVGTFVEVKGFSHQMEGRSRPTFFRGVATIVLKLFNIVEPTRAYFGQKDIQQALLLRQMLFDLQLPNPASPAHLVIAPTIREPDSGLAMSSRNVYLDDSKGETRRANVLWRALQAGEESWRSQRRARTDRDTVDARMVVEAAAKVVREEEEKGGPGLELDFLSLNDPSTLEEFSIVLGPNHEQGEPGRYTVEGNRIVEAGKGGVLSGAIRLGKPRLIDNIVLDFELN